MAEAFLKQYLGAGFEIISAGTMSMTGMPPTQEAIDVMQEEGIDIASYRSKPLSDDIINSAELILVMAEGHRQHIIAKNPKAEEKVHLIKEFAGIAGADITVIDPIGQSMEIYREVKDQLKESSIKIAERLKENENEDSNRG